MPVEGHVPTPNGSLDNRRVQRNVPHGQLRFPKGDFNWQRGGNWQDNTGKTAMVHEHDSRTNRTVPDSGEYPIEAVHRDLAGSGGEDRPPRISRRQMPESELRTGQKKADPGGVRENPTCNQCPENRMQGNHTQSVQNRQTVGVIPLCTNGDLSNEMIAN